MTIETLSLSTCRSRIMAIPTGQIGRVGAATVVVLRYGKRRRYKVNGFPCRTLASAASLAHIENGEG